MPNTILLFCLNFVDFAMNFVFFSRLGNLFFRSPNFIWDGHDHPVRDWNKKSFKRPNEKRNTVPNVSRLTLGELSANDAGARVSGEAAIVTRAPPHQTPTRRIASLLSSLVMLGLAWKLENLSKRKE